MSQMYSSGFGVKLNGGTRTVDTLPATLSPGVLYILPDGTAWYRDKDGNAAELAGGGDVTDVRNSLTGVSFVGYGGIANIDGFEMLNMAWNATDNGDTQAPYRFKFTPLTPAKGASITVSLLAAWQGDPQDICVADVAGQAAGGYTYTRVSTIASGVYSGQQTFSVEATRELELLGQWYCLCAVTTSGGVETLAPILGDTPSKQVTANKFIQSGLQQEDFAGQIAALQTSLDGKLSLTGGTLTGPLQIAPSDTTATTMQTGVIGFQGNPQDASAHAQMFLLEQIAFYLQNGGPGEVANIMAFGTQENSCHIRTREQGAFYIYFGGYWNNAPNNAGTTPNPGSTKPVAPNAKVGFSLTRSTCTIDVDNLILKNRTGIAQARNTNSFQAKVVGGALDASSIGVASFTVSGTGSYWLTLDTTPKALNPPLVDNTNLVVGDTRTFECALTNNIVQLQFFNSAGNAVDTDFWMTGV
jgi:hypothetical protein